MKRLNVGVVGATGIVGEVFLELLAERQFPVAELRLFASAASTGKTVEFEQRAVKLQALHCGGFDGLDLVFFSSGDDISREWAPQAVASGAFAIDNSAAFRLDHDTPLIVPEVNGSQLSTATQPCLIANPNCSTIQLVVALKALQPFGLETIRVATYQAASGAGKAALAELMKQTEQGLRGESIDHHEFNAPLAFNCIPQIGSFRDDGFCTEEGKIIAESQKILQQPRLNLSAFTVRIPSLVGHAEAVWVTLQDPVRKDTLEQSFEHMPGLQYHPDSSPLVQTLAGTDPVHLGRLHQDRMDPKTWLFWLVADNLRKGAALNGLQIAEQIFDI